MLFLCCSTQLGFFLNNLYSTKLFPFSSFFLGLTHVAYFKCTIFVKFDILEESNYFVFNPSCPLGHTI